MTKETPQTVGVSYFGDGLGGKIYKYVKYKPLRLSHYLMASAFVITLGGAIFKHGNWQAVFFSFAAWWFSYRLDETTKHDT